MCHTYIPIYRPNIMAKCYMPHCCLWPAGHKNYWYRIRPNYHTCKYKRRVEQFSSFQITANVLFVYRFIKAYAVGTHLNCIDLLMQFKWIPTTYAFIKKIRKKKHTKTLHKHHLVSPLLIRFFKCILSIGRYIYFTTSFPSIFEKPTCTVQ